MKRLIIITAVLALALIPVTALARHGNGRAHDRRIGAAVVKSFQDRVLTLTLADGSTVSGRVRRGTEIECSSRSARTAEHGSDDDSGSGSSGRNGSDDGPNHDVNDDHGDDGPNHDVNDDHGDDDDGDDNCNRSDLVAGAKVTRARLRVRNGTDFFKKVEVAR